MKYRGQTLAGPQSEIVAFPRTSSTGEKIDVIFKLDAILDYSEFEAVCPEPTAPPTIGAGGIRGFDYDASSYKQAQSDWQQQRINWLVLKTISSPTPGDLKWETVDPNIPESWINFKQELKDSGFNPTEIGYLINRALTVNSLDETRMSEARERFLTGSRSNPAPSTFQKVDPQNTPNGEPANVSTSDLPASATSGTTTSLG